MTLITASNPFKLSICGRFVIEDDGTPHPTVWTLSEAGARGRRAVAQGAAYESEAASFARQGRDTDAVVAKGQAIVHLTLAADLLEVLQVAGQKAAA